MFPDHRALLGHLAYRMCNSPMQRYPFPHIFVRDIFPHAVYNQMLASLPPEGDYSTGTSNYKGRKFADPNRIDIFSVLNDPIFAQICANTFAPFISQRFATSKPQFTTDLRLVRDRQNYAIGPHTDAPWKVLSLLFYLPKNFDLERYGTSIYIPNDPSFRCPGGPHHKFPDFTRIHTAPFIPNSLFAFFKTDYSFHGVEPITIPCQRDVLLWNLYDSAARNGNKDPTPG